MRNKVVRLAALALAALRQRAGVIDTNRAPLLSTTSPLCWSRCPCLRVTAIASARVCLCVRVRVRVRVRACLRRVRVRVPASQASDKAFSGLGHGCRGLEGSGDQGSSIANRREAQDRRWRRE